MEWNGILDGVPIYWIESLRFWDYILKLEPPPRAVGR